MINSMKIIGFKCFKEVEVPLKKITLLTGTNSSGKSSVIQALLLLSNNSVVVSSSPLNGMWLRMGGFDECRNHILNSREFSLTVSGKNDERFSLSFKGSADDDSTVVEVLCKSDGIENLLCPKEKHVFYIPANRQGPSDSHSKNFDVQNFIGSQAEFIVDYLFRNQKKAVESNLIKSVHSVTLLAQVNYWLESLLGVNIGITENKGSNTYSIEYRRGSGRSVRPYHIGSGISYILSVIVSSLSAQNNDIVILENPEIHLHPRAQSELSQFLCFVANAGVQVIVETHSDHVFNGIRKAILKKEIDHNDVSVQFFVQNDDGLSENKNVEINKNGRVVKHYAGLFDQFDEDLDSILGI